MKAHLAQAAADQGRDVPDRASGDPPGAERLPLVVVRRTPAPQAKPSRLLRTWRTLRFIPLVMALVFTGGFIGLYFQPPGLRLLMTALDLQPGGGTSSPIAVPAPRREGALPGAGPSAPPTVVGLGRLLPLGEVVTVAPPFGSGDARVALLKVAEGGHVEQGDVLAVLDSEGTLRAAVASAAAQVASREASLTQVKASVQASRDEARAALARAQTVYESAVREFERAEALRQRGFAAEQAFDQRRAARDEAAREVDRARASLSRYGAGEIDAQADVRVAERNVDLARADLARAEADLEKAYVRAPISGTVLTVHVRPGEKPGSAGLMSLGNIDRMTVEVEIYQAQIGRVSVGDAVEVRADALPQPLKGQVTRIGLEVGRQTVVDANPAANTDARVVKVTAALDHPSSQLARRYTNLQVTARIMAGQGP